MDNMESTVISTRIRLARNFADYPFPHKLKDKKQAREVIELLQLPLGQMDEFRLLYVDKMGLDELEMLKENYLISPALIDKKGVSAVYINKDENVSIMVNEEDHIREQYYIKGFHLLKGYEYLSGIDDVIGDCVKFSYDEKWGYLTACPTNLGTGLRASVMLFLPAITKRPDLLSALKERMRRQGLTVRGVYGEGSEADGYMYQISNEITLGPSEQQILDEVTEAVYKIAEVEIRAREEMCERNPVAVRDACGRAYGILTNCVTLDSREFLQLMAEFKLGVSLGLYNVDKMSDLDDLIINMRDSNINRFSKETLDKEGRKLYRAECVQARLKELLRSE
ncbi:MAG: hypothetical protein IJY26_00090 [Clostridia bacterium]|nr:hypothetical protein [Clostridia bacterium]